MSSSAAPFAIIGIVKKKNNLAKNTYIVEWWLKEFFISPRYFPTVSPMLYINKIIKLDQVIDRSLKVFFKEGPGNSMKVITKVNMMNSG